MTSPESSHTEENLVVASDPVTEAPAENARAAEPTGDSAIHLYSGTLQVLRFWDAPRSA